MLRKSLMLWLIYLSVWLMIAGTLRLETVLVGATVTFLLVLYTRKEDPIPVVFTFKTLPYWGVIMLTFIKDLVLANWALAKLLLSPKMILQPQFIKKPQTLKVPFHQVMYANGITLTPGTLTVFCTNQELVVHCLTDDAAKAILAHPVEEAFQALERQGRV